MLATFVIGLREGLEAALIVGIVATFLRQNGTPAHLRQMWLGVGLAVAICLAGGFILGRTDLPQRQQEMLETVIGAVAVLMVTFMVMWMKAHSRDLKKNLESSMGAALALGSATALVFTAFLAVIREGFETAVFLVASFQSTRSTLQTLGGALLGIAVAVVLGLLIYRGGVRINLSRFFRITGVVLVVVAGGLLMNVLHHAHEAGWITVGQQQAMDLSGLVRPGSVQASLITGVLGIQAQPTWIEVIAWLLYVVPMLVVVLWPPSRALTRRATGRLLTAVGAGAILVAGTLFLAVPVPATAGAATVGLTGTVTSGRDFGTAASLAGTDLNGSGSVQVVEQGPGEITARITATVSGTTVDERFDLGISGGAAVGELRGVSYTAAARPVDPSGTPAPTTLTGRQVAALNGGRLPIGLAVADLTAALPVAASDSWQPTVVLATGTSVPLDLRLRLVRTLTVTGSTGLTASITVLDAQLAPDAAGTGRLLVAAGQAVADRDRREVLGVVLPALLAATGLLLLALGLPKVRRRRIPDAISGPWVSAAPSALPPPSAPAGSTQSPAPATVGAPAEPLPDPVAGRS